MNDNTNGEWQIEYFFLLCRICSWNRIQERFHMSCGICLCCVIRLSLGKNFHGHCSIRHWRLRSGMHLFLVVVFVVDVVWSLPKLTVFAPIPICRNSTLEYLVKLSTKHNLGFGQLRNQIVVFPGGYEFMKVLHELIKHVMRVVIKKYHQGSQWVIQCYAFVSSQFNHIKFILHSLQQRAIVSRSRGVRNKYGKITWNLRCAMQVSVPNDMTV